jgi:streptogramin lyase
LWVVHRQQVDGTVTFEIFRLDGETGTVLDHVSYQPLVGGGVPYGGAVNGKGDLWFIARASIDDSKLLRVDTDTLEVDEYLIDSPGKPYGMTVNADGDPWVAINNSGEFDDRLLRFDVSSQSFVTVSPTERVREYRGIQIDRQGRVWVAVNNPCGLDLFDANDSTLLASDIDVPGCPIGISIDRDGFVWMVDRDSDAARRLNPDTLAVDLEVEGLVAPYTYSDMTGQGLNLVTTPSG